MKFLKIKTFIRIKIFKILFIKYYNKNFKKKNIIKYNNNIFNNILYIIKKIYKKINNINIINNIKILIKS
ncbi:MAG: hypothetical protein NHG07_00495 [Candidatus Shikimatogenerans bostrichidophilus]|nr:MAG: hypothetical protein NHG07_00495 [Candidatus Shikimatogenerans bostrichidophilus]